jgi:hypothetical protein
MLERIETEAVDHTSAIPAGYATGTTWYAAANILAVFFFGL